MTTDTPSGRFAPGPGLKPAVLAGREAASKTLQEMLSLLKQPRVNEEGPLPEAPYAPIKLVGPRGIGKTTLLSWTKKEAEKKGIRVVRWSRLKEGGGEGTSLADLMFSLAGGEDRLLETIKQIGLSLPGKVGFSVMVEKTRRNYEKIMARILAKDRLLLLLDEVQHYDINPLATLLQKNQELMSDSLPLGMVLAGTPGLETHLRKVESTFIVRSEKIYLATLSDNATKKALLRPLENAGFTVPNDALKAMAAQTDNYPFFIQLVGKEVQEAAEEAGRKEIDVKLVNRVKQKAREGREEIYWENFCAMRDKNLLPHARQVMQLLNESRGEIRTNHLINSLVKLNPGMDDAEAQRVCNGLWEDGFIWINRNETRAGIPSFFDYFQSQDE